MTERDASAVPTSAALTPAAPEQASTPAASTPAPSGVILDGPLDAPAIIFVHGTRLTGGMWAFQQRALADEFRTIAIDLPGHGARATDAFTLEHATDVVSAAIALHAPGGRAVVVGLSLGGYVAMNLAARDPDRVRGLVLSGATAEPVEPRSVLYLALAGIFDGVDPASFDRLNAWFFRARYPPEIAEPIIAGGFWPIGGARAVRSLIGERFLPRLAAYPGRTLLINGEFDLVFRPSSRTFARTARDAHRVRLNGAVHLANLDRPRAFSGAVRRFARSLPRG